MVPGHMGNLKNDQNTLANDVRSTEYKYVAILSHDSVNDFCLIKPGQFGFSFPRRLSVFSIHSKYHHAELGKTHGVVLELKCIEHFMERYDQPFWPCHNVHTTFLYRTPRAI